jgi:ureidoacrylate peracid hydrolase
MQNAFCDPGGHLARLGYDVRAMQAVVPSVTELVEEARKVAVPILFTRSVLRPDYADGGIVVNELFPEVKTVGGVTAGSWDAAIIPDLQPRAGEVVDKTRYSAFYRTSLENTLRELQVDTVMLCGVTTTACVESTARDACFRDFRVCVVRDATAEVDRRLHQAALEVIDLWFGYTVSAAEAVSAMRTGELHAHRHAVAGGIH